MRTVLLIRHGKSSWKYPELTDQERPLKKRGRRDAKLMAQMLKEQDILPDLVVSSPALRARATAEIVANEIAYSPEEILINENLYFTGVNNILSYISTTDDAFRQLYLFGHNPDFNDLANQFSETFISNLPTCGVACIDFDTNSWESIRRENGRLRFFDYPSRHR